VTRVRLGNHPRRKARFLSAILGGVYNVKGWLCTLDVASLSRVRIRSKEYSQYRSFFMPNITNYAVVVRRPNGEVETRHPALLAFSYIASSITITLGMLSTPMAQHALTVFALELDSFLPQHASRHLDRARPREFVSLFLSKLNARFPVVVIDEQLAEGGSLGFVQRNGPELDFDTRHQYIHVNATVSG
jgi:hypothetical protein